MLLPACEPAEPPLAPASAPAAELSGPLAPPRTLIGLLRQRVAATAAKDDQRVRQLDAQILGVAATGEIQRLLERYPLYLGVLGKQPVRHFVRTWAPVTAYYLPHADLSRLTALPDEDGAVVVHVPAPGTDLPAEIRVRCVRVAPRQWKVASVTLGPPTPVATTQPATAPATQPVPQP